MEIKELDIFKPDFSFYIDKIKARTISDFEIIDNSNNGTKKMRRCGVQFEDLADHQIGLLENFMRDNTIAT